MDNESKQLLVRKSTLHTKIEKRLYKTIAQMANFY